MWKPDIEAVLTMHSDAGGERRLPPGSGIGFYSCAMLFPFGLWDCRVVFPDTGTLEPRQTARALIEFRSPSRVLTRVRPGDPFTVWACGLSVEGRVTGILRVPDRPASPREGESLPGKGTGK